MSTRKEAHRKQVLELGLTGTFEELEALEIHCHNLVEYMKDDRISLFDKKEKQDVVIAELKRLFPSSHREIRISFCSDICKGGHLSISYDKANDLGWNERDKNECGILCPGLGGGDVKKTARRSGKEYSEIAAIAGDLNRAFGKLDSFTDEDWCGLDLFTKRNLSVEEYKRFCQMLNQVIKTKRS